MACAPLKNGRQFARVVDLVEEVELSCKLMLQLCIHAGFAQPLPHECTSISPALQVHKSCLRNAPALPHECTSPASRVHWLCFTIAQALLHECTSPASQVHQLCLTSAQALPH
eukprot:388059-Pelagomonas_calceolata.AAC.1